MQNMLFIIGMHKSGSSLLRSLFDSNSNLFTIPIETHFAKLLGYWISYNLRGQKYKKVSSERFKENCIEYVKEVNMLDKKSFNYTDNNLHQNFDIKLFEEYLKSISSKSESELIVHYFKALYYSLYKKELEKETLIIEKSVENAEFVIDLKKLFPTSKFIHIIRNPYSNIVSLRKYLSRKDKKYPFLKSACFSLKNNWYFLEKNKKIIENDYKIIRYEDLITDTEKVMKGACEFLNIPFEDNFLIPTQMGDLWQGNSTRNIKYKSVSSANLNLWKEDITPLEISLINKIFGENLKKYDYDYVPSQNIKKRIKKESIIKYFANRFLLKKIL